MNSTLHHYDDDTFLLRLGVESAAPTTGCAPAPTSPTTGSAQLPASPMTGAAQPTCDTSGMEPVDVYCPQHERFLPLATELPGRRRTVVLWLIRAALCGAVVLTAHVDNAVFVYLAALVVGVAVVGLPLRRYATGWRFAVAGWLVCGIILLAVQHSSARSGRIAITLATTAALVMAAYLLGRVAVRAGRRRAVKVGEATWAGRAHRWSAMVAGTAGIAPAALGLYLVVRPQPPDWFLASALGRRVLLAVGVAGTTGWLLLAAIGGVVLGLAATIRPAGRLLRDPRPAPVARWAVAVPAWSAPAVGTGERLYRVATAFVVRVAAAGVAAARGLVNVFRVVSYRCRAAAVRLGNWLFRLAVVTLRRTVASMRATAGIARGAAALVRSSGGRAVRVLVVPLLALASAAWTAGRLSEAARAYLVHGPIGALGRTFGFVLAAAALLSLVWVLLCDLGPRRALRSLGRTGMIAAANAVLLIAVGGWVIGLPGTFGPGPVRVGWVTVGSTVFLVLTAIGWKVLGLRRSRAVPSPQSKHRVGVLVPPAPGVMPPVGHS